MDTLVYEVKDKNKAGIASSKACYQQDRRLDDTLDCSAGTREGKQNNPKTSIFSDNTNLCNTEIDPRSIFLPLNRAGIDRHKIDMGVLPL